MFILKREREQGTEKLLLTFIIAIYMYGIRKKGKDACSNFVRHN